jgi:hypothetical protein
MHPADQLLNALHKPRATFQVFPDRENGARPQILHGPHPAVRRRLEELNAQGLGVFAMVNNGDLQGRRAENVTSITAYFADLDGTPPPTTLPLQPTITIESSPGKYHLYWRVTNAPLNTFPHVQKHIALLLDADPSVHDLPRVLRLPGYTHHKRDPFTTRITLLEPDNAYTHETFTDAFAVPPSPPARQPLPAAVTNYKNRTKPHHKPHTRTIDTAATRIATAPEGQRNVTLYRVASAVAHQVKNGEIPQHQAEHELHLAAAAAGLDPHEISNTIRSAMRHTR